MNETHAGNSPLHLATYSFLTDPFMNSLVRDRARSAFSGIIKRPEVSLSNLLIAMCDRDETGKTTRRMGRTVYFFKSEVMSQYFDKTVSVIPARCMHRLWSSVWELWTRIEGVTYNASRLIDHDEIPFFVVQYDLDWSSGDWRFVTMDNVP